MPNTVPIAVSEGVHPAVPARETEEALAAREAALALLGESDA